MSQGRLQLDQSTQFLAKLPMRQRVAAIGEAILVAPRANRDELAMMLIELASFCTHPSRTLLERDGNKTESAAGPLELLARLPQRWHARHADDAMLALARAWGVISMPMRELGAGLGRDRWLSAARKLSRDTDPRSRLAAVSIAHDTADPGFGKIVSLLLADEHQSVRKAADQALMRMTMVMLDHLPAYLLGEDLAKIASTPRVSLPVDPAVLELERCTLLGAIADAAWSFASHRCRSPLLAALLVMDRAVATPMERDLSARMRRLLSERNHPSHSPMRTVLRRTPCPILRERALRWLTIAPISTAAIDRLSSADSIDEHELVLRNSHLAIRPKRGARLASLHHGTTQKNGRLELVAHGALPSRDAINQLSHESRLGMIRMSSLISIDDHARRDLREPMLADPSVRVRLSACEASSSIDLPDFMYDIDGSVARHASLTWSSMGNTPPRPSSPVWKHRTQTAKINSRSPHAWVRLVSTQESDRLTPMRPSSPASRAQARRMYKADPTGFVRTIRDHLADPTSRCDAIMLIRVMGIENRFELDLISIVQSEQSDARARATAVMALGANDTNASNYILSEALGDTDDRIRSNAVEAISSSVDQILEYKSDPNHRVRASAIRRVIRDADTSQTSQTRNAGHALLEMLHDQRPMHRLAGTWAAQRSLTGSCREVLGGAWKPLINEMESLASGSAQDSEDHEEQIRSRAQRCIHRISSDLHLQNQTTIREMNDIGSGL